MSEHDELVQELRAGLEHVLLAHSEHARTPEDRVRFFDGVTPYAVHPIWCAMTLMTEPTLPLQLRRLGSLALLWHDTLEDTTAPLPPGTSPDVERLVREMTFDSFTHEVQDVWTRSETAKLLKLYDKVSNLLDGQWMSDEKWNRYVEHTTRLAAFVRDAFGELNIVRIAGAVCRRRA